MTILECDIIRGITYNRFSVDPSTFDNNRLNVVLINRVRMRKIENEKEIVTMLSEINHNYIVYISYY